VSNISSINICTYIDNTYIYGVEKMGK